MNNNNYNNDLMKVVRNGRKNTKQDVLNKSLHSAVRQENILSVQEALERGAEINALDKQQLTPLFSAVQKANELITALLLSKGACVLSNKHGVTPLHIAVETGAIEITKLLLKAGAAVNSGRIYFFREYSRPWSIDPDVEILNKLNSENITPLHIAAKKGFSNIIEILCEHGADVNSCSNDEYSPLHFAVDNNQEECILMLLKYGAYIDARNIIDETPIHIATEKNLLPIVELLLKHGAFINSKNYKGFTPLHIAVDLRHTDILKLLLLYNADVNCCANNKMTPLFMAAKSFNSAFFKLFIDHGADINVQDQSGNTILNLAVSRGDILMVDEILKHSRLDMNNESNKRSLQIAFLYPHSINERIIQRLLDYGFALRPGDISVESLHQVFMKGYNNILQHLLEQNPSLMRDLKDVNPLHVAVKDQNYSMIKLLLAHGADINATDNAGKPPLFHTIVTSNVKMTELLLEYGADVKGSPELLITATKNVCKRIVQILLKKQVQTETIDAFGRTALHYTAVNEFDPDDHNDDNRAEIARLLLEHGANVDAKTSSCGISTLHLACLNNYIKIVKVLLKHKADIECCIENMDHDNISNILGCIKRNPMSLKNIYNLLQNGQRPLHCAAKGGNHFIAQLLINEGASVCCKDIKGSTALHVAAGEMNTNVVYRLVKNGAVIDETDNEGQTALHIACKWGKEYNVKYLLRTGADINIETYNSQLAIDLALIFYYSTERYANYGNDFPAWEVGTAIMRILKHHLIKFKTAGLYISEKNQLALINSDDNGDVEWFTNKCKIEITKLKIHKFGNKLVGYDILTRKTSSLAAYFRNYYAWSSFNENRYPIYGRMIDRNRRKCIERISLINTSHVFFVYCIPLPYVCAEKIFKFLDDKDLKNIIELWKSIFYIINPLRYEIPGQLISRAGFPGEKLLGIPFPYF